LKKFSIILGVVVTLLAFSGCSSDTTTETTEESTTVTTTADSDEENTDTTTEDSLSAEFVRKSNTISDEYSELFNTWYSAYDIIAFTDDGEFYLTYDDIGYCISGTYTIEDDIIKIIIDPSTIRDSSISVGDTDYEFEFVDGNLVLTLADDETMSLTYYLDKSVALGMSD
jgi:hypothetical protein